MKARSIGIAAYLIITAFFAVGGFVWTDYAKTKFWWTAWVVIAVVSILAFIGGIFYFTRSKSK